MRLEDFDYNLPSEKIAQRPTSRRSSSRLLVVNRNTGNLTNELFKNLPDYLQPRDLLVVNNTRVVPMRIVGKKKTGGRAEITLVGKLDENAWECLIRTRKPGPGLEIILPGGLHAKVSGKSQSEVRVDAEKGAPLWRVEFHGSSLETVLEKHGLPPLPPYIKRAPDDDPAPDRRRYQTVYAKDGQAAAAPTAGLHFTPGLMDRVRKAGADVAEVRLDVSYGTFAPVRVDRIEDHRMHPEAFELPAETASAINKTKARGGRVIAVGTTAVRTLEHSAKKSGVVEPGQGTTSLFIYPGFSFKVVDAMITNFHMPRSTLIMLVSAFAGRELIMKAYEHALSEGYRFLSYGDAMLII